MYENSTRSEMPDSIERNASTPRRPSLAINGLSTWGPLVINILVGFLLIPYLISQLGKDRFGIWAIVSGFLGYYGLLRMGVGSGIMRYVPYYLGRNELHKVSETISTGTAFFAVIGMLALIISQLVAEPLSLFYKGGPELAGLVRVMGLVAAIECPLRILDSTIRARERWVLANFATGIVSIIRALSLACCVYLGYSVVPMGWAFFGCTVFYFLLLAFIVWRTFPEIHLRMNLVKIHHLKTLVNFGVLMIIIQLVYTLRLSNHMAIIGKLISLEAVALYYVAVMIMRNARKAAISPFTVFLPRFSRLDGEKDTKAILNLYLKGTKYSAILSSAIMLVVIAAGPAFIKLWVKEGFESIFSVLTILAIGYLVETTFSITGAFMSGAGHQKIQAVLTVCEGILEILLCIFLTMKTSLGLNGIAIGFLISVTLVRGIIIPVYICRSLKIGVLRYYVSGILRPWLILLIMATVFRYFDMAIYIDSWMSLILIVSTICLVFFLFAFFIIINKEERAGLIDFARRMVLRVKSCLR